LIDKSALSSVKQSVIDSIMLYAGDGLDLHQHAGSGERAHLDNVLTGRALPIRS